MATHSLYGHRVQKLYVLRGLPGSGKSTEAASIAKEDRFASRVNKDLLREMLHFDVYDPKTEPYVHEAEQALVAQLLSKGRNVIVDDTNLTSGSLDTYIEVATRHRAELVRVFLTTPVDQCIERDRLRGIAGKRSVGPDVIKNMAYRFGYLKQLNPCVIFDLDGTLVDVRHRRHLVNSEAIRNRTIKPDWKGFFAAAVNDTPRVDIIAKMKVYKDLGYDVYICSACPAEYRAMREVTLHAAGAVWDRFLMRNTGDYRPDVEVKKEMLDLYLDKNMIDKVYDDRKCVVDMWISEGLDVEDVSLPGEGDF